MYSMPPPSRRVRSNETKVVPIRDPVLPSKEKVTSEVDDKTRRPKRVAPTEPSAVPSKPVLIPPRTRQEVLRPGQRYTTGTPSSSKPDRSRSHKHDPHSLPPAVAALLAVTSIPQYPKRHGLERPRSDVRDTHKGCQVETLQTGENRTDELDARVGFVPSSLGILLSPPDDPDEDIASISSDLTTASVFPSRSLSSDSIPSLETDSGSTASLGAPPTPGVGTRRTTFDRRHRALSSPPVEDCALDHPLLPGSADASPLGYTGLASDAEVLKPNSVAPPVPVRASFKSNLTASLRALKSAARSFSNFTTPVVQRDEYLTRSILSIQPLFTDEKRPLPSRELPDPVLRRYLNPITPSSAERRNHSYYSIDDSNEARCTLSIQLQTYRRSPKSSKLATSPPVFVARSGNGGETPAFSSEAAGNVAREPRQREPRENSDFLRIIVLELNMRREGKLADDAKGKARLWLPPRQSSQTHVMQKGQVPNRWIGMVPGH